MKSESSESNFVGKRMTNATLSKREFSNKWKSETFHKDEPTKSPKPKTQKETHTKTVFGELGLVMTSMTRTKTAPRKDPNKNQ